MAKEIGRINTGSIGYGETQLFVQYDLISQSIAGNYSDIRLYEYWLATGYTWSFGSSSANLDGQTFDIANYFVGGTHLLRTQDKRIYHNNDGSAGFNVSFGITTSYVVNGQGTTNWETLPTIPRTTFINPVYAVLGKETTVNISPALSTFRHTVLYEFKGDTVTLGEDIQNTFSFTVSTDYYTEMINEKSATGKIIVKTYNGDVLLGETENTLTVSVDEETSAPSLTATVQDTNATTLALTGDANVLIENFSTAKITINPTLKNGATLKQIKVNNINYNTETEITINQTNTGNYIIQVIDSRDLIAEETITLSLIDYINLSLNAQIERNTPIDSKVNFYLTGNYFNNTFGLVNNTLDIKWRYRIIIPNQETPQEWSEYINIETLPIDNTFNYTGTSGSVISYLYANEIEIVVTDKLGQVTNITTVTKGIPIFWWEENSVTMEEDLYANKELFYKGEPLEEEIKKGSKKSLANVSIADQTKSFTAWQTQPLSYTSAKIIVGDDITVVGNEIIISPNVKTFKTTQRTTFNAGAVTGDKYPLIRYNGADHSSTLTTSMNYWETLFLSTVSTKGNDQVKMSSGFMLGGTGNMRILGGNIIVEAIDYYE